MILKIAGSAAVFFACGGFGFFVAGEMERRERELRMLRAAMLLIQGDIRYLRNSLPEAFLNVSEKETGKLKDFFESTAERLLAHESESFAQIFREELDKVSRESALTRQDIALLEQLGSMCEKMDAELLIAAIDWYLEQADVVLCRISKENGEKTALCRRMGILTGIFLLVLLL